MSEIACHAGDVSAKERARDIVLKKLGAKRVAHWCGVSEATVYQWISRGSNERPIPPDRVAEICARARAEGVDLDARALWPAMPQVST